MLLAYVGSPGDPLRLIDASDWKNVQYNLGMTRGQIEAALEDLAAEGRVIIQSDSCGIVVTADGFGSPAEVAA